MATVSDPVIKHTLLNKYAEKHINYSQQNTHTSASENIK